MKLTQSQIEDLAGILSTEAANNLDFCQQRAGWKENHETTMEKVDERNEKTFQKAIKRYLKTI
jgi:hypothetical protein